MRLRTCLLLPASAVLPLLAAPVLAQFQNDFSVYPTGAQSCLYSAADSSKCSGDSLDTMNQCLCSNGGDFITNAARCIGSASSSDLEDTYTTMATNCADSNTPMSVSQAQFLAAGKGTTTAATTKTATSTAASKTSDKSETTKSATTKTTTTPTTTSGADNKNSNNTQSSGSLSTGAKIGIAVASVAGAIAVAGAILFFFLRRRNSSREEARPMLSQFPPSAYPDNAPYSNEHTSAYYDPQKFSDIKAGWQPASTLTAHSGLTPEPSPGLSAAPGPWAPSPQSWDPTHQQAQSWATPPPAQAQQAWATPAPGPGTYPPAHAQGQAWHQPPANFAELSPQQANVYELASMPAQVQAPAPPQHSAVEMPASPLPHPGSNEAYPGQWQPRQ